MFLFLISVWALLILELKKTWNDPQLQSCDKKRFLSFKNWAPDVLIRWHNTPAGPLGTPKYSGLEPSFPTSSSGYRNYNLVVTVHNGIPIYTTVGLASHCPRATEQHFHM